MQHKQGSSLQESLMLECRGNFFFCDDNKDYAHPEATTNPLDMGNTSTFTLSLRQREHTSTKYHLISLAPDGRYITVSIHLGRNSHVNECICFPASKCD